MCSAVQTQEHYAPTLESGRQQSEVTVPFLQHMFSWKPSCSCTCFGASGCCWVGQCRAAVRLLRTLHIVSLIYAIVIELVPWLPCPLTVAETWLEARAGIEPAHGPFLVRVLDAVVYPDLPEWLVVSCAVLVCVAILLLYLRRYHRRTACGLW